MRRTTVVRRSSQSSVTQLRCGDTVLGSVSGLQGSTGGQETLAGVFTHAPAYAEHADRFLALVSARLAGDAAATSRLHGEIESLGIHVFNLQHDMRIDRPGSVAVERGQLSFSPSDAYQIMRTGGL